MNREVRQILLRPAVEAAPLLLGMELYVGKTGGKIVEAEAYMEDDPASHCYGGPRGRNLPMFLEGGHVYVYRSYGVHWCLNIVTGPKGRGEAVLIRALEPIAGIDLMRQRRPGVSDVRLCAGPGNVTRAMGVTGILSGEELGRTVLLQAGERPSGVYFGPRIGITKAIENPWRFCVMGSPFLSRPLPKKQKLA